MCYTSTARRCPCYWRLICTNCSTVFSLMSANTSIGVTHASLQQGYTQGSSAGLLRCATGTSGTFHPALRLRPTLRCIHAAWRENLFTTRWRRSWRQCRLGDSGVVVIEHRSTTRLHFATGAVETAVRLCSIGNGLYDMQGVLGRQPRLSAVALLFAQYVPA